MARLGAGRSGRSVRGRRAGRRVVASDELHYHTSSPHAFVARRACLPSRETTISNDLIQECIRPNYRASAIL